MILIFRILVPVVLVAGIGWFAWKANRENKNPLAWGLFAAGAFLIPYKLTRTIVSYLVDGIEQSSANILALVVSYHVPPILAGIVGCYILKMFLVDRSSPNSVSIESD